ncbi:hypothetical protein PF050_14060 [Kosakonia pseudosacchari]|uniref:hypothetical protein n=1 Tax=Kosakonia TaxID=1330547 RepID=UPI0022F0C528|nr:MULTISPECIES: hypothetical protein [Kosakonia]WBU47616.1 hypothetical protein PF050_14060 [Kosakonia pseudosacchari]
MIKDFYNKYGYIFRLTLNLFIVVVLVVNLISNKLSIHVSDVFSFLSDNITGIFSAVVVTAIASSLISYVNKGIGGSRKDSQINDSYEKLKSELASLRTEFNQLSASGASNVDRIDFAPNEKAELIESAKKRIVGNTLLAADVSLKNDISSFKYQIEINKHYSDIVYRLENEIDRLNRRGGVNLGIGALIALFGILYLGYTVTDQVVIKDKLEYIMHMAPRLSFVIVIELFAYFFLKLYKNGFEEVKYFQNELTNIDSKVLGIKFLKDVRNEELMGEVIKNLMSTERNFVLEKGQSTVSLEQQKIKSDSEKNIMEIMKEFINVKK